MYFLIPGHLLGYQKCAAYLSLSVKEELRHADIVTSTVMPEIVQTETVCVCVNGLN